MIHIYVSPSCSSCRKVKQWFDDQNIPYKTTNIFSNEFTEDDIRTLITKSENGTDDIISPRSKIVQENNIDFDEMKISELVRFIKANPSVLKRPIIVDDRRLQVGYNEDEISAFIPLARRYADMVCANCGNCELCVSGEKN
ncbi:MAG: Spx/MgsR family RNA polymerase-binding regulatory protein [Candidatus Enteromonas sp.]